jgi:sec-independent protein translocase protein TatC
MLTLLAMGIVFEMPAVMLMLARLRIMSSALMRRHWRISIIALAVVAMLLPGVDPISFIVEFIPLLALYGISYVIVRGVERGAPLPLPEP